MVTKNMAENKKEIEGGLFNKENRAMNKIKENEIEKEYYNLKDNDKLTLTGKQLRQWRNKVINKLDEKGRCKLCGLSNCNNNPCKIFEDKQENEIELTIEGIDSSKLTREAIFLYIDNPKLVSEFIEQIRESKEKEVLRILDERIKHCKMAIIGGKNILKKNIGVNAKTRHRKTLRRLELKLEILEELKKRLEQ